MSPPRVLTIAGSDPCGGAGLQADLKTFQAFGCYGMAVVTALTVQDTVRVASVHGPPADFVRDQVQAVLDDCPPVATKTGMLFDAETVHAVATCLRDALDGPLVVDPVMVSTGADRLLDREGERAMVSELLPLASLVTPNHAEAQVLSGLEVTDVASAEEAGRVILGLGARAVLVKGGHGSGSLCVDVLVVDGSDRSRTFSAPRLPIGRTHGTGCTLSAGITCGLALGLPLEAAVERAKSFVHRGLASAFAVGAGAVPVNHLSATEAGESM